MTEHNPSDDIQTDIPAETEEITLESLQEKINELQAQLQEEELRHAATRQDFARRVIPQREEEAKQKAVREFAQAMLTVRDYLDMALADQSGNFEAMKMGVGMTLNEVLKAFSAVRIEEIAVEKGSKPDPLRHEVMREVESGQEPGTIVDVLKKGYTLNGRLIRAAVVSVAKAE